MNNPSSHPIRFSGKFTQLVQVVAVTLACWLFPASLFAAPTFVQQNFATPQSTTATVPVAFTAAQTAGDLNVVVVGWNDTTATVQSVKDSAGNTYSLAIGPTSGTALRQSIYYAPSIVGGANTVTVTFNQAAAFPDVRILEYKGVSALDVTAGATGSSTAANSGAATTRVASELIFGANTIATTTAAAGSGFTSRIITSPDSDIAEDKVVTATGSNSATATLSNAGPWVMQMVTFSAATGPAPTVTGVSPNSGTTAGGTAVTITGTNFATGATVTFGGTAATSVAVTNSTTITATTPAGSAGAATVTVTVSGQSGSLAGAFTYIAPPTVTSVSPSTGAVAGGTAVTITGTNFAAGATVTFGGTAATNVVVSNSTTITATTPAHAAGAVPVAVTNSNGLGGSLASGFTYVAQPTVTGVSPSTGTTAGGTAVTITGTNFVAGAGVTFGGTAATNVVVTNSTTITATTPAGSAGAVTVTVTVSGQSGSLASGYTYVVAPAVTSVSPNNGPVAGGTAVTITGANFAAGATVTFGSGAATNVAVVNSTTITATTPAGSAGAVTVTVTVSGQSGSLASGFTYVAQPTVTGVSPSSGTTSGGTAVTITGTNFVAGAGVTFGGTAATSVVVVNGTTITATTPAHAAGAVTVTVTVSGQSGSLASGYTYVVAPTVTSVSPNNGPAAGGTAVTITGTNFAAGATVTFGGTAATNVVVTNSTTITATTPVHAAGAVTVTVTVSGQSGSLTNGFTFNGSAPTAPGSLAAGAGPGPIVDTVEGYINSTFLTAHTTSPFDSTGGDLMVIFSSSHAGVTLTPSDNFGNTWISLTGPTNTTTGFDLRSQVWYAWNPIVGPNHTVTMTLSVAQSLVISVFVVKGSNISSPIDVPSIMGSDNGTQTVNISSPSVTTSGLNELLIGFAKVSAGATFVAGTGFTQQAAASSNFLDAENGPAAVPGTYAATFTIDSAQTWQSAVVAVSNNPNQTTLSWTASTEAGGTISQYLIERCLGAGCSSFAQVGTTTTTTFNDTGLTASASYSYRVRAQDTNSNIGPYSNIANLATPAVLPSLPGDVIATPVSNTQANLTWTASKEIGGTVSSYSVERCTGATCTSFSKIGTSGTTAFGDATLAPSTTYNYRIRATDSIGTLSPYSSIVTVTTPAVTDTQPPTAPAGLTATPTTGSQINLSWTASTDNVGVTGYLVERCQGTGCSTFAQIGTTLATTYSDTGLAVSTNYSYRVRATDAAGNLSSYSNVASATTGTATINFIQSNFTTPQSAVASATVKFNAAQTAGDLNVVVVGWNDSTASVSTVTDSSGNTYQRAVGPTTVSGALSQSIYYAKSILSAAAGANTVTVQFSTAAVYPDIRILEYSGVDPVSPVDVTAAATGSAATSSSGAATTTSSTDLIFGANMVTGLTSGPGAGFTQRILTSPDADIAEDEPVVTTGSYSATAPATGNWIMQMVAFRSPTSGSDTQPPTAPTNLTATAISGTQINLSWTASTDNVGVTGYLVERCQGSGCSSFAQVGTASGTTYNDTGLTANTSYSYRVRATDAAGNLSQYSSVAGATTQSPDTQPPTAPSNLTATATSGTQINLSWTASTDNVGVTGYLIERCQGAGCSNWARILTVPGTTYSDAGLLPNTSYSYQVKATDAAGNFSPYSNIATTTTLATIPGLVAAYSFDEGSGTTVSDSSGNGNNGTLTSTAWTSSAVYGNALLFNGTNSLITINDSASLHLTTGMTLEAWVNPSVVSNAWRDVIYKGNDNYYLEATSGSNAPAGGATVSGADVITLGTGSLTANAWSHLAFTYDGTTFRIYVNGALVASQSHAGTILTSANPLQIGGDTLFGQYFTGTIDEVRVYNQALTQAQIQADMGTPIGSGGSQPLVILSGNNINFGSVQSGASSSPQSVTVTNVGGATLTINSIAVSGGNAGDFTATNNCGGGLVPNGSCTINVNFVPTTTGARTSSVAISDNAPGTPQTIALSGTGTGFAVLPRVSVLTPTMTQQFTAGSGVTWTVDGVAGGSASSGTITTAGLYSPPAVAGNHTVTATTITPPQSASAAVHITTYAGTFTHHNDNLRTGQNTSETVLTPANVTQAQFGKLFSYNLDGVAFASPLYVANVSIPGQGFHNVVYVATEHDSVYAWDADGLSANPLWQVSFLKSGVTSVPCGDTGECGDIPVEIGITGTPVIDPSSGTLYVVAKTKEGTNYVQRLHALDITTGAEKFGGPVVIQATVPGTGEGSTGSQLAFNPLRENQRPALVLSSGSVYIGWASHGDQHPWHGWVIAYNATSLVQTAIYCTTPNATAGGIWSSGGGLGADSSGNIYFTTGNGDFDANTGGADYGDSVVKLNSSGGVVDYFTPFDESNMQAQNFDLSSAGPVLLLDQPGSFTHELIAAAKTGTIYVVNRDNMGHFHSGSDSQIIQSLPGILPHGTEEEGNYSAPAFFNGYVYFAAVNDNLKAFQMTNGLLSTGPTSQSLAIYPNRGGSFAASGNANTNGILWAVQDNNPQNGVLHAYDAGNLATEFYNSGQAGSRDTLGVATKFSIPLVANGKVFVGAQAQLFAYGLLP